VWSQALDFDRRFGGIARLYGEQTLQRFQYASVCVIGIGGVGSWAAEALARSAVGNLTLIDMDHVAESNMNRQLPALDANLGRAKTQVMSQRIQQINPACNVRQIDDFLTLDNLHDYLDADLHLVLDCMDSFRVKAALIHHCRELEMRLIVMGGAGGQKDPARIQCSDLSRTEQDPLLAKTRRLLRQEYGFPRDPRRKFNVPAVWSPEPVKQASSCADQQDGSLNCAGFGSSMPVTATFGMIGAAEALRHIADMDEI
jgi:tRNA A37 threonylcarbamoyladenosine dehydratase